MENFGEDLALVFVVALVVAFLAGALLGFGAAKLL